MRAKEALELYFLDNRARLLEIASFLDRIDRYSDGQLAREDFRYKSFLKAIKIIVDSDKDRTKRIQQIFSDPTDEPLDSVSDPKAYGAWKNFTDEGN
jgi:hypothetical protein